MLTDQRRKSLRSCCGFAGMTLAITLGLSACAGSKPIARNPGSLDEQSLVQRDLRQNVRNFRELLARNGLNGTNCQEILGKINSELYQTGPTDFDTASLKGHADEVIQELFLARLELRSKLAQMVKTREVSPSCVVFIRDLFRVSRFMEEYLAEWKGGYSASNRVFEGGAPSMMVNPAFTSSELRSGDVLLSRGNAVVSAAIARIGDEDGQFSHIALVYVDEVTHQAYTIEAHIEIGAVVAPIEKYLQDGKIRSVVYRHPDARLAHQAAKRMYEKVRERSQQGRPIPYDFGMDLKSDREVFCSEVAYAGFKNASEGQLLLPLFQTGMHAKNRKFLNDIGVKVDQTFAPGDIDVDPRFELVAEWRDLSRTEGARILDIVLTRMYDWMESRNYILENTLLESVLRDGSWLLRRSRLFGPLLQEKFPKNMSASALGAMISLDSVGTYLKEEVEKLNAEQKAKTGFGMTPLQMKGRLEILREQDYAVYSDRISRVLGKSKFHSRFHPAD